MYKGFFFVVFLTFSKVSIAQSVDVQADYNSIGDCIFSGYNNTNVPVFLYLNFADLENTSFTEPLPYVKQLTPGYNQLFTLQRDLDADVPRFNYEVKSFRSNPMPDIDLKFPYLIPFQPGTKVHSFDVDEIKGFMGNTSIDSWTATGFSAKPGDAVYASRNGVVVEIVGEKRNENPETWYNAWTRCITLLQSDGTLVCYKNVINKNKKLKTGEQFYAGELLGEIAPGAKTLVMLIYHHSLHSSGLLFIIPEFVIDEKTNGIVNSATEYTVVHPVSVRGQEMTKKERKKVLGKN